MYRRVQLAIILVVTGVAFGCVVESSRPREGERIIVDCTPPYRLTILALDMVPDPVAQGQPIDVWRVTLRSDRDGACHTLLEVSDQNQLAGRGVKEVIRPGKGTYTIAAAPNYRMQQRDRCYIVQANAGGAASALEAIQSFCAKPYPGNRWSLRGS